jgi:hypothetical protein
MSDMARMIAEIETHVQRQPLLEREAYARGIRYGLERAIVAVEECRQEEAARERSLVAWSLLLNRVSVRIQVLLNPAEVRAHADG